MNHPSDVTVDQSEVAAWDAIATTWWNPSSETRWLHRYNPVRVAYIRDAACRRFQRDPTQPDCLHGLRILDIGCGAGVLCEPIARLGATIVGADPAMAAVQAAKLHGRETGVNVDYRCTTAAALADAGERFDVVLAMEVIEHVADSGEFLRRGTELVKPGGLLLLSTINRTFKSYVFAVVIGEYILRLLPRGTHQWDRFVTPDEIRIAIEKNGLRVTNVSGVTFNLISRAMQLTKNTAVNYILTTERPV